MYAESKKAEHKEVENRIVIVRSKRVGRNVEMVVKWYKLSAIREVSSGDLMYGMVTIINNTVLYI